MDERGRQVCIHDSEGKLFSFHYYARRSVYIMLYFGCFSNFEEKKLYKKIKKVSYNCFVTRLCILVIFE